MLVDLERGEIRRLCELTERTISDLRVEIRRTSTPTFHDTLVMEQRRLEGLLEKLRAAGPSGGG